MRWRRGPPASRSRAMEALAALINADVLPVIPGQGSVGASGDLAPLAHMSLVLIGEGEAHGEGRARPGRRGAGGCRRCSPWRSAPRKGWRCSTARRSRPRWRWPGLVAAERNAEAAILAGAMSVDAVMGSDTPFDPRIHALRPHPGQQLAAVALPPAARRAARSAPRISKAMTACRTPIPSAASRR